ncbi:type II secretion system protein [Candidatus Parcubacteria bacterium]|nr:type II secretion system protein [Candidatus Parcubacteria bacterium]
MFKTLALGRRGERAFTLVELLVVIAIIGILATIVLVSLNTARIRARDTKRLGDIRQIQLALELFADSHNQVYPNGTAGGEELYGTVTCAATPADGTSDCGLAAADACGSRSCMSTVPRDPTGSSPANKYFYTFEPASAPTRYHLGANLEESTNSALTSDRDCEDDVAGGATGCGPAVFVVGDSPTGAGIVNATDAATGVNSGCQGVADFGRSCYDVTN